MLYKIVVSRSLFNHIPFQFTDHSELVETGEYQDFALFIYDLALFGIILLISLYADVYEVLYEIQDRVGLQYVIP